MSTTPPTEPPYTPPPPPEAPPAVDPIPWEKPGYPALEGLYETIKLFVVNPSEGFARMPIAGDLVKPLLFTVILGWVGVIVSNIYSLALRGALWNYLPGMSGMGRDQFMLSTGTTVAMMIFAPVLVLIGVFIWAGIVHLFLMLVGGATSGFTATLRVVCYTQTTQLAQIVPACGGLISFIWSLVLSISGLAIAHRTTQGKAALAVLLPVVLCCVCLVIVIAMTGAGIAALVSGSR